MKTLLNIAICATLAVVVIACADQAAKLVGGALVDAGEALRDAKVGPADAAAQDACAKCTASAEPATVLTADTDMKQLVGDSVSFGKHTTWKELSAGPLVVTDLSSADSASAMLGVADPGKCGVNPSWLATDFAGDNHASVHGARIIIPAGKVLCGATYNALSWAGFRPYR